jgi:hypothetical protein
MNWHIGMDLVAIRAHLSGYFKEGDVFTIRSLKTSECACKKIMVDIGHKPMSEVTICSICEGFNSQISVRWHGAEDFKPLDTLCDISELTEILETTKPYEV